MRLPTEVLIFSFRSRVLQPVRTRRATARAPESIVETADRVETRTESHLDNLFVRRGEQPLRMGDAMVRKVIDERRAKCLFEKPHGVIRMQAHLLANLGHRELLGVTLRDQTRHLFDLLQLTAMQTAGAR